MNKPFVLRHLILVTLTALASVAVPATADAEPATRGYAWTEAYIPSTDGTVIHADILRPKGIPAGQRTPTIMTVSPYRSHLLYITTPRLIGGPATENLPVQLFLDRGYTYVIADLRGYGGSTGCPDFGGPGEQADVKSAVEWVAAAPWSNGKVGLYGVSYEGSTGIMGLAAKPKGLAAVASFAPVVDAYTYEYMQGVSWKFFLQPLTTAGVIPADPGAAIEHSLISMTPGRGDDTATYRAAASSTPLSCYQNFIAQMHNPDPAALFWKQRNLVDVARGTTVPTFLGQGFLDANTRPYRLFDLWNALGPGDNRAWFTQTGHRDCFTDCRDTFPAELVAFFDKHVADKQVSVPGPRITVGTPDGGWRGEAAWPPTDVRRVPVVLRPGQYVDRGFPDGPDREVWTVSEPLTSPQHLSGAPTLTARVHGPPDATLAASLYDIAPDGRATAITRGIAPLGTDGQVDMRILAQDWQIPIGHRIGVRLNNIVDAIWAHQPTSALVTVDVARIELPLLTQIRHADLAGAAPSLLDKTLRDRTITLDSRLLDAATVPMSLPGRTGN